MAQHKKKMRLQCLYLDKLAADESEKMPSVAPFVPRSVVRARKKEKDLLAKNKALAEKGTAQLASVSTPTLITESQPEPALSFTVAVAQFTISDSNTCATKTTLPLVPPPLAASVPPLVRGFFGEFGFIFLAGGLLQIFFLPFFFFSNFPSVGQCHSAHVDSSAIGQTLLIRGRRPLTFFC
jgi:hypothetical protein